MFQTAELHLQHGELLLALSPDRAVETEANFQTSLEIAFRQHRKAWQLRTTISLARLWHSQGETARARQVLAEIYDSFREGHATIDLTAARSLLDELSP